MATGGGRPRGRDKQNALLPFPRRGEKQGKRSLVALLLKSDGLEIGAVSG